MALIKPDDWNQVHIIARGHQLTHIINGQAHDRADRRRP